MESAPAVSPGVAAVLALQRTVGNARTGRVLGAARGRRLQRMPFKRFEGVPDAQQRCNPLEHKLLLAERAAHESFVECESWALESPRVQALREEFRRIRVTPLAESEYEPTLARLRALVTEIRDARIGCLNERGRELPGQSVFSNGRATATVGEVASFAERGGSWAEHNAGLVRGFRVTVPVKPAEYLRGADPGLLEALNASIGEHQQDLRAAVATGSRLIWVYAANGTLTIGDIESSHSVLAAGADVWAAGEARLKHGAGGELRQIQAEIKGFKEKLAAEKAKREPDERTIVVLEDWIQGYGRTAAQLEAPVSEPGRGEAGPGPPTIVVNLRSGHYQPSKAWAKTHEAWESLGYRVEWDPEGWTR